MGEQQHKLAKETGDNRIANFQSDMDPTQIFLNIQPLLHPCENYITIKLHMGTELVQRYASSVNFRKQNKAALPSALSSTSSVS